MTDTARQWPATEAARRWFTETINAWLDAEDVQLRDRYNSVVHPDQGLVDAILSGVQVGEERGAMFDGTFGLTVARAATHARPVLRLPAEPIRPATKPTLT